VHDVVDLRSDTLTTPTPEMRAAMAQAEVGDDVWGEDPTVQRLEARAAERCGKAAGLFLASGTMGNQVAVLAHTQPGQEVLVESEAHMLSLEVAGIARLALCQTRPLDSARGLPAPEAVRAAIRPPDIHYPVTGLLALENTHNRRGGTAFAPEEIGAVAAVAREHGIPVHLDGARLFNACVALGRQAHEYGAVVDTIQFCVSKGLAAPVGSVLVGPEPFIQRARRMRKLLGGGMRQVGVLAAAGLIALDRMVDRLAEDHANARRLAEGLAALPGIRLDPARVQTNIVIFDVARAGAAAELVEGCRARKVKIHAVGPTAIRCVTHKDVDADDVERALSAIREITADWQEERDGHGVR
jgi:threonine aldolase